MENILNFGLTKKQVESIKLPNTKYLVKIWDPKHIVNSKKQMSSVERLEHLYKLKVALENKLELISKHGI